jgi:hypothetical protein
MLLEPYESNGKISRMNLLSDLSEVMGGWIDGVKNKCYSLRGVQACVATFTRRGTSVWPYTARALTLTTEYVAPLETNPGWGKTVNAGCPLG